MPSCGLAQFRIGNTMTTFRCSIICFTFAVLVCLDPSAVLALKASKTLFGRSDYHHEVALDSSFAPLEFLATFDLEQDGTFEISLDIDFSMNTAEDDDDRVMLYLLACDEISTEAFLSLPLQNASTSSNDKALVPPYCSMPNRTLDFYCQSFPLENQSYKRLLYQTTKTVTGSVSNVTSESTYSQLTRSNSTKLNFFIDACELLGGNDSILRSCLNFPPPISDEDATGKCFYCPANYPYRTESNDKLWREECVISPAVERAVQGFVAMNLCTASGDCLWKRNNYVTWFYVVSTILWGGGYLIWMWHIYTAPTGEAVDLHYEMAKVPLVQLVYTALAFAANYTEGEFTSPKYNVIANIALIAQILALVQTTAMVLRIAAGWKVTQLTLDKHDIYMIHCVVMLWSIAFIALKQLEVEHIAIVIFWGISWFSILILVHYYSTANLKMLRKRFNIGAHLNLDTSLVMGKGTLFLQFRRLQKAYLFVAAVTALCGSDNRWYIWQWISVQGHEMLNFLFYASLAYICRCQQFRFRDTDNLEINVELDAESNGSAGMHEPSSTDPVNSASVIPVLDKPILIKVATVLILNPDKSVALGTAYASEKRENVEALATKKDTETRAPRDVNSLGTS